ncbi:MAG TPA: transposase, partial [Thermoguttaceae bacterium]
IDVSVFDARYDNEETGAPAYDPALLLKLVLYAYSRGMLSSREIERACRENVIFMALSADTQPHFTTIAHFISSMATEIEPIFRDVLLYCDELGLIGKELFAIDGCKLPANASKAWSGTKAELQKKRRKLERAVQRMLQTHRERDAGSVTPDLAAKEAQYRRTLRRQIRKLKGWLADNDDKIGKSGKPLKSNLTDNESAKMKTSHGVIQGYDGLAAVDSKHQIIVAAQAFGAAQEHDLLLPLVEGVAHNFTLIGEQKIFATAGVTADTGFHTEANLKALQERRIAATIADQQMRKRDPRFMDTDKYRARTRKERQQFLGTHRTFSNQDFVYDEQHHTCLCPAGKSLYRNGAHKNLRGYRAVKFRGTQRDCLPCPLRNRCLRHPDSGVGRQVAFFQGTGRHHPYPLTQQMKQKIDSPAGQAIYKQRLGTVADNSSRRYLHFRLPWRSSRCLATTAIMVETGLPCGARSRSISSGCSTQWCITWVRFTSMEQGLLDQAESETMKRHIEPTAHPGNSNAIGHHYDGVITG